MTLSALYPTKKPSKIFRHCSVKKNVSVWDLNIYSLKRGIPIRRLRNKNSIDNEKRSRIQEQELLDRLLTPIAFIHSMAKQFGAGSDDGISNEDEEVYSYESEPEEAVIPDRPLCPVCMDPAQVVDTTFIGVTMPSAAGGKCSKRRPPKRNFMSSYLKESGGFFLLR